MLSITGFILFTNISSNCHISIASQMVKNDRLNSDSSLLTTSGTEALFADLAHFPVSAIQLAFTVIVFPCLLLTYMGQAAYLMQNKEHVVDAFYRSIPGMFCFLNLNICCYIYWFWSTLVSKSISSMNANELYVNRAQTMFSLTVVSLHVPSFLNFFPDMSLTYLTFVIRAYFVNWKK